MLFTWSNCISFNQFCGLSDAMRMWQWLDGGCDSEAEGDDDCLSGIIYLLSANWIDESLISFYTLPVAKSYWPFGIWSVNNNINNTGEMQTNIIVCLSDKGISNLCAIQIEMIKFIRYITYSILPPDDTSLFNSWLNIGLTKTDFNISLQYLN